jgi:hypothetical protein
MKAELHRKGPKVDVPSPGTEPLRLGRVGVIAVVAFGIGVAWPHLAGVRLVPRLPDERTASSAELTGSPEEAPGAQAQASAAILKAAPPDKPIAAKIQPPVIGEPQIAGCKGKGNRRIAPEECDAIDFDRVARERLQGLEHCDGWGTLTGVLSVGFELDFETERVTKITSGKSTTLDETGSSLLLDCYRKSFANLALVGIPHRHQEYSVYYRVELKGAAVEASGSEPPPVTPASGRATVNWEVALVRATPTRDGEVLARVLSGTRVVVTGRSGDWYRVKFDAKGSEGWVFRASIGL